MLIRLTWLIPIAYYLPILILIISKPVFIFYFIIYFHKNTSNRTWLTDIFQISGNQVRFDVFLKDISDLTLSTYFLSEKKTFILTSLAREGVKIIIKKVQNLKQANRKDELLTFQLEFNHWVLAGVHTLEQP